jgi:transposase
MAVSVASGGTEEAIAGWEGLAQHLYDEVGGLRGERDRLSQQVAELTYQLASARADRDRLAGQVAKVTSQLAAAKAELIKLTLALRHESERQPRPGNENGDGGDVVAGDPGDGHPAPAEAGPQGLPQRRRRGQRRGAPGHGRRRYDHLSTTEVIVQPSPEDLVCPDCGSPYAPGPGEDVCEQLDWKVSITRVLHRRPRWHRTCRCPAAKGVVAAPPPPKVIPKGRMSVGMLARLLVAKYVVGTPCARLAMSLGLEGAGLATGTLAEVLANLAPLLAPLAGVIRARNAASGLLHVDETSWPVFVEVVGRDNRRWWLWVFVGPDTVAYIIRPGRDAGVAAEYLGIDLDDDVPRLPGGRAVVLCSDFYSAYQSLGKKVAGVTNSWCWAHIRRHFLTAGQANPDCVVWAEAWLTRIGALFHAHHGLVLAPAGSPQAGIAAAGQAAALAAIDTARRADAADPTLPVAAAKALATLDREWAGLMVPLAGPVRQEWHLDNNVAERALRSPVVGRKNYYGSGAIWSAELAADAWSITATAKLAGWNPLTHLQAYLSACAANGGRPPQGAALEAFLPWGASPEQAREWSGCVSQGRGP